eukprot:3882792-Rhodomonas_salina.7
MVLPGLFVDEMMIKVWNTIIVGQVPVPVCDCRTISDADMTCILLWQCRVWSCTSTTSGTPPRSASPCRRSSAVRSAG